MHPPIHRDETRSASPWLTPGLVASREVIIRTILDPDHLGPDGKLAAAAIALEDIRFRGWSVDRKLYTSPWRIKLSHSRWRRKKPHLRDIYALPVAAKDLRQPDPATGRPAFVVIDAALWLNPAHATVLLAEQLGQGAARGLRNKLVQQLPPYVDVKEVFASGSKFGFSRGMFRQVASIVVSLCSYPCRFFARPTGSSGSSS